MGSKENPAKTASKPVLIVILGLPVLATFTIIGFGVYNQWDQITPRWKDKRAPSTQSPASSTTVTNQPTTSPAKN